MNHRGFSLIIVLLAFLAVILGFFYFYSGNKIGMGPGQNDMVIVSPIPTSLQADETANPDSIGANWKTYTNTEFNFAIKYPQGWTINDQSYNSGGESNIGFAIQSPLRSDITEANGKSTYYIRALKWDSTTKTLVPNKSFGNSGEQFILQKEPGDQAGNEVLVSEDFIKNSAEHKTADQVLSTFKLTP